MHRCGITRSTSLIKYALVHDFVEVYAGDTYFYRRSEKEEKDKNKREGDARERLIKEYPEFKEFCDLMTRYELREDDESRFVYALDKILPILNIYLDGGRSWKADNVTLDMLITGKKDKVAVSNEIKPYFDELVEILSKEKSFFHETKQDK